MHATLRRMSKDWLAQNQDDYSFKTQTVLIRISLHLNPINLYIL
jgi:hypothetical protein